jgi:hypothetical protein
MIIIEIRTIGSSLALLCTEDVLLSVFRRLRLSGKRLGVERPGVAGSDEGEEASP